MLGAKVAPWYPYSTSLPSARAGLVAGSGLHCCPGACLLLRALLCLRPDHRGLAVLWLSQRGTVFAAGLQL